MDGCFGGCLGRARGRPDDEAEPADWLHGGATVAFRSVQWPGRTANPAVRSRGRPIGSGAPVSLFSHPLSLCGRRFLSGPPPLALAVSARCSVCLGCRWRACGCTGGRCRSEDRRTSAPAGSRPHRPKSAGRSQDRDIESKRERGGDPELNTTFLCGRTARNYPNIDHSLPPRLEPATFLTTSVSTLAGCRREESSRS